MINLVNSNNYNYFQKVALHMVNMILKGRKVKYV